MGLLQVRGSTARTPEGLAQDHPLIDGGALPGFSYNLPSPLEKQAHLPTAVQSVCPTPRRIDTMDQAEVLGVGIHVLWTTGPEL